MHHQHGAPAAAAWARPRRRCTYLATTTTCTGTRIRSRVRPRPTRTGNRRPLRRRLARPGSAGAALPAAAAGNTRPGNRATRLTAAAARHDSSSSSIIPQHLPLPLPSLSLPSIGQRHPQPRQAPQYVKQVGSGYRRHQGQDYPFTKSVSQDRIKWEVEATGQGRPWQWAALARGPRNSEATTASFAEHCQARGPKGGTYGCQTEVQS